MKNKEDFEILNKLLHYLKPYKLQIVIVLFCILLSAGINIVQPFIGQVIMDQGLVAKNSGIVIKFALIILAITVIDQVLEFIETIFYTDLNNKYTYSLFQSVTQKC